MAKRRRPVETIKFEGLTAESLKKFEPKKDSSREDALWDLYFRGSPNLPSINPSGKESKEDTEEKITSNQEITPSSRVYTKADTQVESRLSTLLSTRARSEVLEKEQPKAKEQKSGDEYISLDSTHTAMEAKIYSVMYRETVSKQKDPQHFGSFRLRKLTGIGSNKTIRKAIKGLLDKKSIFLIDPCPNHPLGPVYRALHPKDIFMVRKNSGIEIHPQTKKITSSEDPTGVGTGLRSQLLTRMQTPVKNSRVTPVESSRLTHVKGSRLPEDIPYISKNYINTDDSIKNIESSSISNVTNDENDETFNHKNHITEIYERYTNNRWNEGDNKFYQSIKNVLPDVIEAAIIATILRTSLKVASFSFFEGTIKEFQGNVPPGYLGYLRGKWRELKASSDHGENDLLGRLRLPSDSFFQEEWLQIFLSNFPKEEQIRVKRLAEQFDHFMLTGGEKKEWVRNPTGAFVGLIRGEMNLRLPQDAPSFEERVGGEDAEEKERFEREKEELRRQKIEEEIREAISSLKGEEREKFIAGVKKKYNLSRVVDEEYLIEIVVSHIFLDINENGETNLLEILEELKYTV